MTKRVEHLDKRVRSYAIAAASGAALLAPASLHGEVVYHAVNQTIGYGQSVGIAFNQRGTADFTVTDVNLGDSYGRMPVISLTEVEPNHEIADVNGAPATAFQPMAVIGPSVTFSPVQQALLASGFSSSEYGSLHGPFAYTTAFAGVAVEFHGKTFYGWIRIGTGFNAQTQEVEATVTDYAYQTKPNTPIQAGQGIPQNGSTAAIPSGSLGALALGARGVETKRSTD